MSGMNTRSAIYMRVSKDDGSQGADNQLLVLKEEIERDGEQLVVVYVYRAMGIKERGERTDFERMFPERRRFDLLRFWALDRFSREGIRKTSGYLQRLHHLDVRFKSHTEPHLNTDNELIAHIVLGVTSYYAQLEAQRIFDRTKAGLARARTSGKMIGLPGGYERWQAVLQEMLEKDFGKKRMSRETGLSYNTVKSYLARMEAETGAGDTQGSSAQKGSSKGKGVTVVTWRGERTANEHNETTTRSDG